MHNNSHSYYNILVYKLYKKIIKIITGKRVTKAGVMVIRSKKLIVFKKNRVFSVEIMNLYVRSTPKMHAMHISEKSKKLTLN